MKKIKILDISICASRAMSNCCLCRGLCHFPLSGFSRGGTVNGLQEYGLNIRSRTVRRIIRDLDSELSRKIVCLFAIRANVANRHMMLKTGKDDAERDETEVRTRNLKQARQTIEKIWHKDGKTGLQVVATI